MSKSDEMSDCWACREKLTSNQKYCHRCKHWQNWRQYTTFSSTILSLLIALFSVSAILVPVISKYTIVEAPVLDIFGNVTFKEDDTLVFILDINNLGSKTVVIQKTARCQYVQNDLPVFMGENFLHLQAEGLTSTRPNEKNQLAFSSYESGIYQKKSLLWIGCDFQLVTHPKFGLNIMFWQEKVWEFSVKKLDKLAIAKNN